MRLAWLDEQLNKPSRTDHYIMQVSRDIVQGRLKKGHFAKIGDFFLNFVRKAPPRKLTVEEEAARAKAVWFARTGTKKQD